MANTSIPINTNPTSDPQYTGGEVVLPSDDSVIDINPINENAEALANAVNQLFWDVSQGGGGGTNAQVEINRQNIGAPAGTVLGTNLQTQVNNLGNRVSTAEGDINTLSSNVNTLSGTVSGLSSSVTSLGNRLTTAEGNITADETQIGNIKSAVGIDNTGALTPTVAGTLAKQVADNTGSITNLNTQVGANVIGSTSDTSSQTTVYGYVNGVKDIADANLATLQTLGGGTVPTDSLNNLMDQKLATYTPQVEKNSVFEAAIQDNAVTTDKIRDGAVTHNKLGNAYELLTAQPADWATSYVDYYTIYQLTTAEPADWGVNYDKYYTKSGSGTQANPYVYTPVTSLTTWTSNTYYSFTPTQVSGGSAPSWEFGTYYSAQPAVMSENIGDGEVKTNHIENGAITYDKLSQTLQNQSSKVSNINEYILSTGTYNTSYASGLDIGTVTCNVEYRNYNTGRVEVFVEGYASATNLPNSTISITVPLGGAGISFDNSISGTFTFADAHIESASMALGTSASPSSSALDSNLSMSSNNELLIKYYVVLDTGNYRVLNFRVKVCGGGLVVTPPSTT